MECGYLRLMNAGNDSICAFLHIKCSELVSCANDNRACYRPDYLCVSHPRCQTAPLCYPVDKALQVVCPPMLPATTTLPPVVPDDGICESATWNVTGVTVAGGNGAGSELNELNGPLGLFVDDDAAVYVADTWNDRIVKWVPGASIGSVVAGGNGEGNQNNQLDHVAKVVVAKNGTMFICDRGNSRVQRWFKNDEHGQTIIANISCLGLAMDNEGSLYVCDGERQHVIKWHSNDIVAGKNGERPEINQLLEPVHIFVDQDKSVIVADFQSARVMKWPVGVKEGIVVAGGNGEGDGANQLNGMKYSTIMLIVILL
ncbi:unnamed protein product [Rotaria sp. Silwood2]|nr:unnamed protein product [Rotaria sp. Silwood2]CAF2968502.1 unnamed protein product [Rotaria sp. Silwood2]CAF3334901.1 unnamed protein product [Rotaria sp. Silwood2]CAF3999405.1 unnamed protein product [Rotaria sp. Silwood2]CAF4115709.1 unnamed protein product [Rotaria sp. Silwood2]